MKNVDFVDHVEGFRVLGRIDDYLLIEGICEEGDHHFVINDRSIPAIHEGVVEVDQETFYSVLANLAHYKYLLEQEDYEECGEVYESFNLAVEAIYEQACNEENEIIDLGAIEFIYEMVNQLKDHDVDEDQFQDVVTGVCDVFIKNMVATAGVSEFLQFPASQVHNSFIRIYKAQEIGEARLAEQFATDCIMYTCFKLSKLEGKVH